MSGTRRDFLRQVGSIGGYRATYLTMQAMGLLSTAVAAEPLVLQRGGAHGTKVVIWGPAWPGSQPPMNSARPATGSPPSAPARALARGWW
jgi:hypothetical protein